MKNTLAWLVVLVVVGFGSARVSLAATSVLEQNKKTVKDFYDMAFNQHKPVDAAMKYLAPSYIQHNPTVADGRQGFIDAFSDPKEQEDSKDSSVEFKRVIAEGDLVVLHSHGHYHKGDLGYAVVDIFRVTHGKITEHWDVGKKVPAESKNKNTMF